MRTPEARYPYSSALRERMGDKVLGHSGPVAQIAEGDGNDNLTDVATVALAVLVGLTGERLRYPHAHTDGLEPASDEPGLLDGHTVGGPTWPSASRKERYYPGTALPAAERHDGSAHHRCLALCRPGTIAERGELDQEQAWRGSATW